MILRPFWVVLIGLWLAVVGGCADECYVDHDCRAGSYCAAGGVCAQDCSPEVACPAPECLSECCPPAPTCTAAGRCSTATSTVVGEPCDDIVTILVDGWDDPAGLGVAFVLDRYQPAPGGSGFDLDGACDTTGCVDNALASFAQLYADPVRRQILQGELRIILELAGYDPTNGVDDDSLTLKTYLAVDADEPPYPANDFEVPPGETECCRFLIRSQDLLAGAPPQARHRQPARIERGQLRTLAPAPLPFGLPSVQPLDDVPSHSLPFERAQINFRLPRATGPGDGLVGGLVRPSRLAQSPEPFCGFPGGFCPPGGFDSQLDMVVALVGSPDIDVDGDGLECIYDDDDQDLVVDGCCEAPAPAVCNASCVQISPTDPEVASSCTLRPEMADAYSAAFVFTVVPAQIVGIAP